MVRGMQCALGDHKLSGAGVYVTEPAHIGFVRKRVKNFRPENRVCKQCLRALVQIYNLKTQRANVLRRLRKTLPVESSTSLTSETAAIAGKPPAEPRGCISSQSSLDQGPSTSAAAAAAAAARQQRQQAAAPKVTFLSQTTSDSDDFVPSPNAVNGTRLPHIQPIPRRQQFVHANPDVLDIYLAGTSGG